MINAMNEDKNNNYYHKVYRHVIDHFDSSLAGLLIARLEYWFSREQYGDSFYKFLEPSNHRAYVPGDSWTEELKVGRKAFNKLFDRIGTRYKSKSDYVAARRGGNAFGGKLYLSYYDRGRNQMYYKRNHAYAQQLLGTLFKVKDERQQQPLPKIKAARHDHERNDTMTTAQPAPSVQVATARTTDTPAPQVYVKGDNSKRNAVIATQPVPSRQDAAIGTPEPVTQHEQQQSQYGNSPSGRSLYIQINTNNSSSKQNAKTKPEPLPQASVSDPQTLTRGEDMHKIWLEEVGHCNVSHISPNLAQRMASFLKSCLGCCLKAWRAYCRKIASSKFLMGEVKAFKAWLSWVINPATFDKIQAGEYTLGDRELKQTAGQQQDHEAQAQANVASQPTEDDQTFHKHLLAQAGAVTYNNWLKNLQIISVDQQTIYFKERSSFIETRIRNSYESLVIESLMKIYPNVKQFTFQKKTNTFVH